MMDGPRSVPGDTDTAVLKMSDMIQLLLWVQ